MILTYILCDQNLPQVNSRDIRAACCHNLTGVFVIHLSLAICKGVFRTLSNKFDGTFTKIVNGF